MLYVINKEGRGYNDATKGCYKSRVTLAREMIKSFTNEMRVSLSALLTWCPSEATITTGQHKEKQSSEEDADGEPYVATTRQRKQKRSWGKG